MITAAANSGRVSNRLAWARISRPASLPGGGAGASRGPAFHFAPSSAVRAMPAAPICTRARIRVRARKVNSGVSSMASLPFSTLPVVRRLAGDHHVVDMALAQAGAGDAHEPGPLLEVGQGRRPDIAHGGAQAADHLVQRRRDRTLVGRLTLDALGHQLLGLDLLLEVSVGRAGPHGATRAHAPVRLG